MNHHTSQDLRRYRGNYLGEQLHPTDCITNFHHKWEGVHELEGGLTVPWEILHWGNPDSSTGLFPRGRDVWNIYISLPYEWFKDPSEWNSETQAYSVVPSEFGEPTYLSNLEEDKVIKIGNDYAHVHNDAYYSFEEILKDLGKILSNLNEPDELIQAYSYDDDE